MPRKKVGLVQYRRSQRVTQQLVSATGECPSGNLWPQENLRKTENYYGVWVFEKFRSLMILVIAVGRLVW